MKKSCFRIFLLCVVIVLYNVIVCTNYFANVESSAFFSNDLWDMVNDDKIIAVTGDSYAGVFCEYESSNEYYNMIQYARSGKSIVENEGFTLLALNSNAKYVLLSIGPNDYTHQTPIAEFEKQLTLFADEAKKNHKVLLFHTYMEYPNKVEYIFSIKDYDKVLRKVADENEDVYYIDMSDYEGKEYMRDDYLHYSNIFNDVLFYRIVEKIITVININKAHN